MALSFSKYTEKGRSGRGRYTTTRYIIVEGNKQYARSTNFDPNKIALAILDRNLTAYQLGEGQRIRIRELLEDNNNLRYLNMQLLADAIYANSLLSNGMSFDEVVNAILTLRKEEYNEDIKRLYKINLVRYIRYYNNIII